MRARQKRSGFTLVEMLVATALTLFTMAIITQAFVTSMEVFSQLKGIGDMEEGLRVASTTIRSDLSQDHFEGKRRLSDANFWDNPILIPFQANPPVNSAVQAGFFHIRQGTASTAPSNAIEGSDSTDGIPSYLGTDHVLHFTIKLRGNRPEKFPAAVINDPTSPLFGANASYFGQAGDGMFQTSGNLYTSQWAEVAYYLVKTGTTVNPQDPNATGTGLYALYRYQALVVPRTDEINASSPVAGTLGATYVPISYISTGTLASAGPVFTGNLYFPNPTELPWYSGAAGGPTARSLDTRGVQSPVTFPVRSGTPYSPEGTAMVSGGAVSYAVPQTVPSASLVLSNVVSFNVRVLRAGDVDFTDPDPDASGFNVFDTSWDPAGAHPGYLVGAVQITIRVWDTKTRQARQITIVQDM